MAYNILYMYISVYIYIYICEFSIQTLFKADDCPQMPHPSDSKNAPRCLTPDV